MFGNLAIILWIVLDSVAFWLYNQVAGWLFLIVALIAVYGVLRFFGCLRPCFNYKKCTTDFGRLSALFFGKRSLKDPKESYGMISAVFFYTLIGPLPAIFLLVFAIQAFTLVNLVILIGLWTFTIYSGLTWFPKRRT